MRQATPDEITETLRDAELMRAQITAQSSCGIWSAAGFVDEEGAIGSGHSVDHHAPGQLALSDHRSGTGAHGRSSMLPRQRILAKMWAAHLTGAWANEPTVRLSSQTQRDE
jgi:hypothetical protein